MNKDDPNGRENLDAATPGRGALRNFWRRKKWPLFWWALCMALVLLVLWPSVIATIKPGHVGVLYRRFLGGTEMNKIFREGTHLIFPWDKMHIFDARLHEEQHTMSVLNNLGLKMELDITVIYHPLPDRTPVLLTTVGADYREKLVIPIMLSSVRGVAAKYDAEDFFSASAGQISDEMLVSMIDTIGRNPVIVDNLLIRRVHLPESLNQAINAKLVAQQKVFELRYTVNQAAENYKRKYIDASAVSMTQKIVNERMSEAFLRWQGIEATRALAESGNSKTVLFGGGDGLPVILNLEGQAPADAPDGTGGESSAEAAPQAAASGEAAKEEAESEAEAAAEETDWLDIISADKLENISKKLEEAIGLPLYNHKAAQSDDLPDQTSQTEETAAPNPAGQGAQP